MTFIGNGHRTIVLIACTVIVLLVSGCNFPPAESAPTISEIVEQNRAAVVRIQTADGSGSGTLITSEGHILTNWHVIDGYSTVNVLVQDKTKHRGQVLGFDERLDLAVVKIHGRNLPFLDIDTSRPSVGEEVIVIGYPRAEILHGEARVTRGIVSGFEQINGGARVQTDAAMNPGNSGGAVLNSEGKFIGVPTWAVKDGENIGFFTGFFEAGNAIARLKAGTWVVSTTPTPVPAPTQTTWPTPTPRPTLTPRPPCPTPHPIGKVGLQLPERAPGEGIHASRPVRRSDFPFLADPGRTGGACPPSTAGARPTPTQEERDGELAMDAMMARNRILKMQVNSTPMELGIYPGRRTKCEYTWGRTGIVTQYKDPITGACHR